MSCAQMLLDARAPCCCKCSTFFSEKQDQNPKFPPCGHTLCSGCTDSLSLKNQEPFLFVVCPICGQKTWASENSMLSLPVNTVVLEKLRKAKMEEKEENFDEIHSVAKVMKTHVAIPLVEKLNQVVLKCLDHDEPLKLYCSEDNVMICLLCRKFGDHKTHETELIYTMVECLKKDTRGVLKESEEFRDKLIGLKNELLKEILEIDENHWKNIRYVDKKFSEVIDMLKSRREELKKMIELKNLGLMKYVNDISRKPQHWELRNSFGSLKRSYKCNRQLL